MARVAGFDNIKPNILVKLMVLEYNSVLRENIDDLYNRQKDNGIVNDMQSVEEQAKSGKLSNERWISKWNKPEAITWLASEPSLTNVNLQDYFWISREALKNETPIENSVSNIVRTVFASLKKKQTVGMMKKELPNAIKDFSRDEKDMLVILLNQELKVDIGSGMVIRFLDADENDEIVASVSLLKSLFDGLDTTKLTPAYAKFLKRMSKKPDCKKYVEEMNKSNSLKNALK